MAGRAEFELPNVGWDRRHVTDATPDCISQGERERRVYASLSPAASPERRLKVASLPEICVRPPGPLMIESFFSVPSL